MDPESNALFVCVMTSFFLLTAGVALVVLSGSPYTESRDRGLLKIAGIVVGCVGVGMGCIFVAWHLTNLFKTWP